MIEDFTPAENTILTKISSFCAYRERSVFEVKNKLISLGCNLSQSQKIINWLIDNNFLNQNRFDSSFVRSKVNQNKWGRVKIKNQLKQKGSINEEALNEAIANIDLEVYESNLLHILDRKLNELNRKQSEKINEKLIRHALSKGFTFDEIFNALKKLKFNSTDIEGLASF
jgi:regulatory protein